MPNVTDADFKAVLEAPVSVVYFWSNTCPICTQFTPVFDAVAAARQDVLLVKANVQEANQSAQAYGLSSVPTVVLFKDGKEVDRVTGGMSKAEFVGMLDQVYGAEGAGGNGNGEGNGFSPVLPIFLTLATLFGLFYASGAMESFDD
jgi:thioredoxin 1